jgi:large subunit ribosomal protein L17
MRHRKKINHLSRKAPHRKAMLANMASSLILHKRITTTTAKAKALRSFVEPVITRSRDDSTHSRRMAFRYLRDKEAVSELFRDVAVKVGERPGGYTRIIKLGSSRAGDSADMCIIELVDYNENLLTGKSAAKPKTGRRRRGGKKKEEPGMTAATHAETVESLETEAPEAEAEESAEATAETEAPEAETEEPDATGEEAGPESKKNGEGKKDE